MSSGASHSESARWCQFLVALGLVIGAAAVGGAAVLLERVAPELNETEASPRGIVDLELAFEGARAGEIVAAWRRHGIVEQALTQLQLDALFIALYSAVAVGTGIAGLWLFGRLSRRTVVVVALIACLPGGLDLFVENPALEEMLRLPNSASCEAWDDLASRASHAAAAKFLLLLPVWLVGLTTIVAAATTAKKRPRREPSSPPSFDTLVREELPGTDGISVETGSSGEPRVSHVERDLVGLALSGGGIRSATFNLGLLQGLHRAGLLRLIDYLSTVSGGGYIGGFWTRWRLALDPEVREEFPASEDRTDPSPIRHLREFSRFLIPRVGFFDVEAWNAVVAFVGGVLVSLVMATCLLALALLAGRGILLLVAHNGSIVSALATAAVAAVVLTFTEIWFWRSGRPELPGRSRASYVAASAVALPTVGLAAAWTAGLFPPGALLQPGLACLAATIALMAVRAVFRRSKDGKWRQAVAPAIDRVVARVLATGTVGVAIALVWLVAEGMSASGDGWLQGVVSAGMLGSGGTLVLLRGWMERAIGQGGPRALLNRLKAYLPQVLAYLVLVLAAILIARALYDVAGAFATALAAATTLATVLVLCLFLDPHELGLHGFYRDRIARAYLGAGAYPGAEPASNRGSDVRPADDAYLADARDLRPHHLICCAANDLSGDHLGTLYRGCRSAVLTPNGVVVGNHWVGAPKLRLSSALTASAAAFNPAMGSVSMELGPAVGFVLAALNLRLGLWVRHPKSAWIGRPWLPGLLIVREMLGTVSAGSERSAPEFVHLSDGGHFENLGLYELIRRHCRFVLVSDCGADPEVAFDDLGNAVRRVREDFGVEIEIDLAPLAPNAAGISTQHVVVGRIDYGTPGDEGILVYVKPTLTDDEPSDVRQYHARNPKFPHESTGDQFYDEAQWEAYRRLGEHVVATMMRFVAVDPAASREATARSVFADLRQEWYPTPSGLKEQNLAMTARYAGDASELDERTPPHVLRELFPELPATDAGGAKAPGSEEEELLWVLRASQMMEDVWAACSLDTQHNHPLNLGWINWFQRIAGSRTYRRWWPLVRPLFGSQFRRFVEERFDWLRSTWEGRIVRRVEPDGAQGLAGRWFEIAYPEARPGNSIVLSYEVAMPGSRDSEEWIEIGLLRMRLDDGVASWRAHELFVPPSLWGAGFGSRLFRGFVAKTAGPGEGESIGTVNKIVVTLDDPKSDLRKPDVGTRNERADLIAFYRRLGFALGGTPNTLVWNRE